MTEFITEQEAADLLGMSDSWLRQRRYKGDGPPHYDYSGRPRYIRSEVVEWAKRHGDTDSQKGSEDPKVSS